MEFADHDQPTWEVYQDETKAICGNKYIANNGIQHPRFSFAVQAEISGQPSIAIAGHIPDLDQLSKTPIMIFLALKIKISYWKEKVSFKWIDENDSHWYQLSNNWVQFFDGMLSEIGKCFNQLYAISQYHFVDYSNFIHKLYLLHDQKPTPKMDQEIDTRSKTFIEIWQ